MALVKTSPGFDPRLGQILRTCRGAAQPALCSPGTAATKSLRCSCRSLCSATREATARRSRSTATGGEPLFAATGEETVQPQRPSTAQPGHPSHRQPKHLQGEFRRQCKCFYSQKPHSSLDWMVECFKKHNWGFKVPLFIFISSGRKKNPGGWLRRQGPKS